MQRVVAQAVFSVRRWSSHAAAAPLGAARSSSAPSRWADLRAPEQMYPKARLSRRKVVYHGGPTNSGKTYSALQALKAAKNSKDGGVYAGPLRLLALEVYERLNKDGVYCSLFTGQERHELAFATHASCTIEMVPLTRRWDVAVIDEIQMIGSQDRGHAWTRALLGLDARELHVCGALDAADLVKSICGATGDDFELRTYERLTPFVVQPEPLKSFADVAKGDCIVTFSRDDIHQVRREIEKLNPALKCCVVYGQLPPETRAQQARLFNAEDSGYDVLVASDAIGMGLNLNIGRVLFRTVHKFAGHQKDKPPAVMPELIAEKLKEANVGGNSQLSPVEVPLVKQIAGRAGRAASIFADVGGGVSALSEGDLAYIRWAVQEPDTKVTRAGIFPPSEILSRFAAELAARKGHAHGQINLMEVVPELASVVQLDDDQYFLSGHAEVARVAEKLASVPTLSIADMLVFCSAPCNLNDRFAVTMLTQYAEARATGSRTSPNVRLPMRAPKRLLELHDLCSKHNILDLYLWLAFRFPETFTEQPLARQLKLHCIQLVAAALESRKLELPPPRGQRSTFVKRADAPPFDPKARKVVQHTFAPSRGGYAGKVPDRRPKSANSNNGGYAGKVPDRRPKPQNPKPPASKNQTPQRFGARAATNSAHAPKTDPKRARLRDAASRKPQQD